MFDPRQAWRLVVATLALGLVGHGGMASAQSSGGASAASKGEASAADAASAAHSKRRDSSDWGDWRNYRPSIGGGIGVTFDQAESSYEGITRWAPGGARVECAAEDVLNPATCIRVGDSYDGSISGGAFNLVGRLTLPEFDVRSKPQLFLNASWAVQRQGQRALSKQGYPEETWISSGQFLGGLDDEKYLHIEQTLEPKTVLFLGLGASFELPIEAYPVRISGTVSYFRAAAEAGARYDYTSSPTSSYPAGDDDQFTSVDLVTHGIAPGVGIDVVIGENEWFEFGFYSEFFVGIPLSGDTYEERLTNGYAPNHAGADEKVDFQMERNLHFSTFVGLRVSLARD